MNENKFYIMMDDIKNDRFLTGIELDNTIPRGIFGSFENAVIFTKPEIAQEVLRIATYKLLNKTSIVTIKFDVIESRMNGKLI